MNAQDVKDIVQRMLDAGIYPSDRALFRVGITMNSRILSHRNQVLEANGYTYRPEVTHGAKWVKA
jgi:hypothetical protein